MYSIPRKKIIKHKIRDEHIPMINSLSLDKKLKEEIILRIEKMSHIIKKVNSTQVRRIYGIVADTNSLVEVEEFLKKQIDRDVEKEFYKEVKKTIEEYKNKENLKKIIYTFIYEILLYKKSLEEK